MKQTSKLTRNQRNFLEEHGIKDTRDLRFCHENKKEFIYYNKVEDKVYTIIK